MVAQNEVVGEFLLELRELLAFPERDGGARGRERVCEDVEGVDAVPAVHLDLLIHQSGSNREAIVRLKFHARTESRAKPVVHIFVDAQIGPDGVDISGDAVVVRGDAN